MARQRGGKGGRGTAKAQRPKPKAAKATTKSASKATTKSVAKAARTAKTAKTTRTAKTTGTGRPKRTAAKPARVIQKSMPAADVTAGLEPTLQEVQERAYQIYLARNGAPGDSTSDWLQAERELRDPRTARTTSRKRKSRSR